MIYPLIFGEVLFDQFAGGESVLGGAPFNVAWHLKGFGLSPLLLSRVGDDDLGRQILAAMQNWHMDCAAMQVDAEHATGTVQVALHDGQPDFDIVADVAYDYIDASICQTLQDGTPPGVIYHGSLALRSEQSRQTLAALKSTLQVPVFLDVNLRPPWWQPQVLSALIQGVQSLKLNDHEILQLSSDLDSDATLLQRAQYMQDKYQVTNIILTRGAQGALLLDQQTSTQATAVDVPHMVDTVGAGDGFSAVALYGLLHGWPAQKILKLATDFAARICGLRGAITQDQHFYKDAMQQW